MSASTSRTAIALLESDDLLGLGELADLARRLRGGTRRGLLRPEPEPVPDERLPREVQVLRVRRHAASRSTRTRSRAEELVEDAVAQHELTGFTEIHMVNGENPHVGFDFYVDTIRQLHAAMPAVHLKCYTASEIHHMTTLSGLTHEAGAARAEGRRARIASGRRRGGVRRPGAAARRARQGGPEIWFHVHDTAHRMGIPTHCTMLYGHVETYEERIDHLLRLRDQQDKTGGFLAFIPLAFHPENTVFERAAGVTRPASDDLKMLAVSRLMLDNVENIKAYWIMMGMPLAAVGLHFGANDVQGTVVRETIFHAAGRAHRDGAEGRAARPLRAGGGPHPRPARHALQRDPALA